VWCLGGGLGLQRVAQGPELLAGHWLAELGAVTAAFVPALRDNTDLIRFFYAQQAAGRLQLWLAPPPTVKIPAGAVPFPDPRSELPLRQQLELLLGRPLERGRASLGGVRRATQTDIDTLQAYRDLTAAERHPGWPALSFLPRFDPVQAAHLLHLIGDPRWYVDAFQPDSFHRLRDAFGLGSSGEATMAKLLAGRPITAARNGKFACQVVNTWYCGERLRAAQEDGSFAYYPWRIYSQVAQQSSPARALLAACRSLLRTVCDVWLDNLTPPREYDAAQVVSGGRRDRARLQPAKRYGPQLFVPRYVFSTEEQCGAWEAHVAQWRTTCGGY
jgi:hypothetical protein